MSLIVGLDSPECSPAPPQVRRRAATQFKARRTQMVEMFNFLIGTGLLLPVAWVAIKVGDEIAVWTDHYDRRPRR